MGSSHTKTVETVDSSIPENGENIYEEVGDQSTHYSTDSSLYTTIGSKEKTFTLINEDKSHDRHQRFSEFFKWVKLFAYFLAFVLILTSSILSKSTIILMSSMISVNSSIITTGEIDSTNSHYHRNMTSNHDGISGIFEANDVRRIEWLWCLFIAVIVPEVLAFFRSVSLCTFSYKFSIPKCVTILTIFATETLNSIGVALLVFFVMPTMDSLNCVAITSSLCFVPALLILLSERETKTPGIKILDTVSFVIQVIALIVWPVIIFVEGSNRYLSLPIALFFVSLKWFENFHDLKYESRYITMINEVKRDLKSDVRHTLNAFISVWKIAVMFASMIVIELSVNGLETVSNMFSKLFVGFYDNDDTINESKMPIIWILLLQITASYLCYALTTLCCKIGLNFSFSLANNLTFPLTLIFIVTMNQTNKLSLLFPTLHYADWYFHHKDTSHAITYVVIIVCMITITSQLWSTMHIWSSKRNILNPIEKNFVDPMYSSVFIDQSLALNRRLKDDQKIQNSKLPENNYFSESEFYFSPENDWGSEPIVFHKVINIIACVTLWHETSKEMTQMVESIMRLDCDQLVKQLWPLKSKCFNKLQPYKLEVNIIFDDAYDGSGMINKYVTQLIETLDKASKDVYKLGLKMKPMKKLLTPYGGRLEWLMPGETKFIVHLKDTNKIRNQKRWSQIMYMSFLLEHRMKNMNYENGNLCINDIKKNTFILALDGDISFGPRALELLIETIMKNVKLGAVCGRIHPNKASAGKIAWYQKFDYANSHWLQKSSEHVFGSVLCSPGCFSLYRAEALLDVMDEYSQETLTAAHKLQRDMGEDRWLCTLLLIKNWCIDYCAASDAYTFVPETFLDFLVQQIRWKTSTVLNVINLLRKKFERKEKHSQKTEQKLKKFEQKQKQTHSQKTDQRLKNITIPYALYQSMLAVSTFLTPGTTFLMIVGAIHTVMRLSVTISLLVNTIVIIGYGMLCQFASDEKKRLKLIATKLISIVYGLLMMAVLFAPLIEIKSTNYWNPNSLFFIGLMAIEVIAAILHPQEWKCIFPLIFYLLWIPYTFLILPIYALTHMHDPQWGTREDKPDAKPAAAAKTDDQSNSESNSDLPQKEWTDDSVLSRFKSSTIYDTEKKFWQKKLEESLGCKHSDKNETEIKQSLEKLKDNSLLIFGCVNVAFVILIYILQLHFSINFAFFVVDPLGISLVVFFGLIIVFQFIAMIVHRFTTLVMLLAFTEIDFFKLTHPTTTDEEYIYAIHTINKLLPANTKESALYEEAVDSVSETPPVTRNLKQLMIDRLNAASSNRLYQRERRSSAFEYGLLMIPEKLGLRRKSEAQVSRNGKRHSVWSVEGVQFHDLPDRTVMIGHPIRPDIDC